MSEILEHLPTWRYHREYPPRIFTSQEEFDAAGVGWVDNPDKFKDNETQLSEILNEPIPENIDNSKPIKVPSPDYRNMKVFELRRVAKTLGISFTNNTKKSEFIHLIEAKNK